MDLHSAHPGTHLQSLAAGSLVCAELAYTMMEIEHVRTNWQTCQLWSPNSSNMASSRVLQSSYTFWSGLLFLREFTHILSLSNSLPHPPKHPMWSGFTHTHKYTHTHWWLVCLLVFKYWSLCFTVSAEVWIALEHLSQGFVWWWLTDSQTQPIPCAIAQDKYIPLCRSLKLTKVTKCPSLAQCPSHCDCGIALRWPCVYNSSIAEQCSTCSYQCCTCMQLPWTLATM